MKLVKVTSCVGIDPGGGTIGIGFLDYVDKRVAGKMLLQVDALSANAVLKAVLATYYSDPGVIIGRFAGVEAFKDGKSAGTRGTSADVTRQTMFELSQTLQEWCYAVEQRRATDVKPWASDTRLKIHGLLGPPEMRHANDGMRQALFTAKHDAHMPDPLR